MSNWLDNISLEGDTVRLVPLEISYKEDLLNAASDGKLWELWFTFVPSKEEFDAYIENALIQKEKGDGYPFVVIDKKTNKVIGSTRYCNVFSEHRRLEIGYTWYAKSHQKTRVNTECKYLLLKHAFETLDCIAVEFMTNWFNLPSRTAIAKLGAKQDGVLRNHRLNADGSYRDTVVFSITNQDWLGVKKSLKYRLNQ